MKIDKASIFAALDSISHPVKGQGLTACGSVLKASACDGYVAVGLSSAGLDASQQASLRVAVEHVIKHAAKHAGDEIKQINIEFDGAKGADNRASSAPAAASAPSGARPPTSQLPQHSAPVLPGVKHAIAVGAGKGGVGKSTIAVNLALGLARRGHSVGLLDGDIYGPSLPTMLGLHSMETNVIGGMLQPFMVHGIKAMTIGKLVDPEKPLIWRGPMAHGAFKQLVEQTTWGELDYLIIDLPPGTGDVSLTMAQMLRLSGAVVVCTPQRVAQDDAIRALRMYQQLGIEILGVVENMSYFIGDDGKEYDLFGRGGAEQMAQRTGTPFLGAVPITMALRQHSDSGEASANFDAAKAGGPLVRSLEALCANLEGQVALAGLRSGNQRPTLTVS